MSVRKMIASLLAVTIALTFCSCAAPAEPAPTVTLSSTPITEPTIEPTVESTVEPTEVPVPTEESELMIDVDENLLTVEVTVSAQYVGEDITQDSLDEDVNEGAYVSAKLNDDGSVTYVMTKQKHKEMLDGVAQTIDDALADMIGSDEYPMYTAIEANDDYTAFKITTTSEQLGLVESISAMAFYVYGGMYSQISGTPVDDITVTFVSAETGEELGTGHSSNMGKSAEDGSE